MNIYKQVMQDIERDRIKAKNELDMRKEQVYLDIPRIEEIDKQISDSSIKIMRLAYTAVDIEKELNALKEQTTALKKERQTLLLAKYPDNFLEIHNTCNHCQDTGSIDGIRCSCVKIRIANKYFEISELGNVLEYENFDHFDLRLFSKVVDPALGISAQERMQEIFKVSLDFAYNFENKYTNLLFYGASGLGKTFLCHCIADDMIKKGIAVLYTTANRLAKNTENARFNKDEHDPIELELYHTSPLLIIDDLGTEFSTIVTQSEMFDIINSRLIKKRATIISTNLDFKNIKEMYSSRIVSRLFGEYKSYKFIGEDIRIAKKIKSAGL